MGVYRGVQVPDALDGIIGSMREVEGYCEELSSLGEHWDLLSVLGQMSRGGTDMAETREGFRLLTGELLAQLGTETLKKAVQQITSKAQVAVDIAIRNLFERTADIGFLSTDDDVRGYLVDRGASDALVSRFREYVAKYSVYHDIVLLDPDGTVLARIDERAAVERTTDPLVQEALVTSAAYVEAFRHSDLFPNEASSLIYAYRVTASNDRHSKPLGVLCLGFRFANEMAGVFRNLSEEGDWSTITLLDRRGVVIASSDPHQVPLGAPMTLAVDAPFKIIRFAGRQYLAKTCATQGYQGYMGLGWYGHVVVPLEHAFERNTSRPSVRVDEQVLNAVMSNTQLFTSALQRIPADADAVQQQLDRAVWNGNVRQDAQADGTDPAARVLLREISRTGGRTKSVFERSISNLHETIVSSLLSDVEFLASLAIDIMDRNLYERANDCRWWALTTTFRQRLSASTLSPADVRDIGDILAYINGLYTVYASLFVYDRSGTIRAVSRPVLDAWVGRALQTSWVAETMALATSQQYTVCAFEQTDLYGGLHTYIYGAAITGPGVARQVVGGIGIVFDARSQFEAMLRDSLPRTATGEVVPGCFGVLAEPDRTIVSTTNPDLPVGGVLDLDPDLFTMSKGHGTSRVVEWRGRYYAVGARSSAGYREYKGDTDSYQNAVTSLILVPLGDVARLTRDRRAGASGASVRSDRLANGSTVELATFYAGRHWIAVRAESVVEAVGVDRVTGLPQARAAAGLTLFRGRPIPVLSPQAVLGETGESGGQAQIVVLDTARGDVGVMVDGLGDIAEVAIDRIDTVGAIIEEGGFIQGVVRPGAGEDWPTLLLVVDATRLVTTLFDSKRESVLDEINRFEPAA